MTPGHSTRIGYAADVAGPFTEFAEVKEITPPTLEADDIDTSHMTTPDQVRSFAPGWADAGELEAVIAFEKSQAATIYGLFRAQKAYRIMFNDAAYPNGSTLILPSGSYIKSVGQEVDREDETLLNLTIKVSGKPIFTPAD